MKNIFLVKLNYIKYHNIYAYKHKYSESLLDNVDVDEIQQMLNFS